LVCIRFNDKRYNGILNICSFLTTFFFFKLEGKDCIIRDHDIVFLTSGRDLFFYNFVFFLMFIMSFSRTNVFFSYQTKVVVVNKLKYLLMCFFILCLFLLNLMIKWLSLGRRKSVFSFIFELKLVLVHTLLENM